jgi:Fe-S cluster assembly protein SufB
MSKIDLSFDYSKYNFRDIVDYEILLPKGLNEEIVREISRIKNEPSWMEEFRVKSFKIFMEKPMPTWGVDLSKLRLDDIHYYAKPTSKKGRSWDEVPEYIKRTFERLGIPEAERKFLAGVGGQYDSEVVYHNLRKELEKQGVIFVDTDTAVREYPEIVKKYFGTVVPPNDNKFAALNSAVWSGGSFIYVPEGVKVEMPLQAYFRINAQNVGQFERTLIIAEPYSEVQYIEGCLPPGEKVSLGDSWINIEAIKPGDFVVTHRGTLAKVKLVMTRNYKGDMYKITPISPFNSFSLTEEHPVLAIKREWVMKKRKIRKEGWLPEVDSRKLKNTKPEFIPVRDLKKGDFLIFPKIKNEIINSSNLSDEEIEFLGFYTAEGSAYYHKKLKQFVVSLSFSEREKENIERVRFLIEKISGKKAILVRDKKKHSINVVVYSKPLYDLCLRHCGKLAKEKRLSPEILNLPKEKLEKFFWAYFKGDGNLCIKNGKSKLYRVATASINLAIQLQEILAKIGIFASIQERKGGKDKILGREIKRKNQYIIAFTYPKKWSEVRETEEYYIVPIKKIEKFVYEGPVFNLEVERDNSYLVKGFAVHNCTAPVYLSHSLHSAVVEIIAKKGAKVRYTTIQNWSIDVYNLVTKRAHAYEGARVEWVDANIGSKATMKYPSVYLLGKYASAEIISVAFAGKGQHQDTGGKVIHLAPYTSSRITSKSVSKDGGRTTYRGLLHVAKGARGVKASVRCDALLLDEYSKTDTYPYVEILEDDATVTHEATVGKISEDQLFYLMSRGIPEVEALNMIVLGFFEPFIKELPMEYAVEMNRLLRLEMTGSVG